MRRKVAFLTALLLAASCGSSVADFDENVANGLAGVEAKITAFLAGLESAAGTPEAAYERHAAFYPEVCAELAAVKAVAAASPRNDLTVKAIEEIEKNLASLETAHRGGLQAEEVTIVAALFESQFDALLRFETAKRNGPRKEE